MPPLRSNEWLVVVPAYGRDYTTAHAARAAWSENRDFRIVSLSDHGRYVNKSDVLKYGQHLRGIEIRFNRRFDVVVISNPIL